MTINLNPLYKAKAGRGAQRGLSLVELMISILLGFIVSAAMISLFISAKQSYRVNENLARLQENGRFAVSFISRDLRMADYRACVTDDLLSDAVSGENDSGLNGSDSLTIQWQTNDCIGAPTVVTTIYTVEEGASGEPALFRSVNGVSQEVVEGIDNLQILYGEDTDDDNVPNYYVDAENVSDMAQAINVKFTVDAITPQLNVAMDGGAIDRSFASAVTLRNRVP